MSEESPEARPEHLLEESKIDPVPSHTEPDKGTKLFVLFFFLIVPPLGIVLAIALLWTAWKTFNT